MPYTIKKQGDKWVKINKESGKVVSHHDSKEKAEASVRAYYANKNEGLEESVRTIEYRKNSKNSRGLTKVATIYPITEEEYSKISISWEKNKLWKKTMESWSNGTLYFEFNLAQEIQEFIRVLRKAMYGNTFKKINLIDESKFGANKMDKQKLDLIIEQTIKKRLEEKRLIEKEDETQPIKQYTSEEKKAFLNAVSSFNSFGDNITDFNLKESLEDIKIISEMAANMMRLEAQDEESWLDKTTISKNVKSLETSIGIFMKTAKEIGILYHRLKNSFSDIGSTLDKYFDVKSKEV